jgi:hypoxia up-regulated 1
LFDASDKARRQREEDLNNLEALTYKTRDLIEDSEFTNFASKEHLAAIQGLASETGDWLSEEGAKATSEVLKEKLDKLKGLIEPVRKRKDESTKRPEWVKKLRDTLSQAQSLVQVVKDTIEQNDKREAEASASSSAAEEASKLAASASSEASSGSTPIDPLEELEETPSSSSSEIPTPSPESFIAPYTNEDLTQISDAYEKVNTWLEAKLAEQDKLPAWDEPVFSSGELQEKFTELNDGLMKLFQRKLKPTKAKSSKAPKATKSAKSKAKSATEKAKSASSDAEHSVTFEIKDEATESPKASPKLQTKDEL